MMNPNETTPDSATSVTGHDGYIMGKALAYAIAYIQSLPEERQEFSDMCDMAMIARQRFGVLMPLHVLGVEAHTGQAPDLCPEDVAGPDVLEPEDAALGASIAEAGCALRTARSRLAAH